MDISLNIEERTLFSRLDLNLVMTILALNIIGLINLYSATHGPNSVTMEPLFINQIVWLTVGWGIFFIFTLIDYSIASKAAIIIFILNMLAIVYTTFFGKIALGAQRWIDFGFFKYQPSETMKLALIIIMAKFLASRSVTQIGMGLRDLIIPVLLIGIPCAFIIEQPDLGTAMTLAAIGSTLIVFNKVRKAILVVIAIMLAAGIWGAWNFMLHDYQKDRVRTFITPTSDPRGKGYNSIQSKIAVGSGQIFGKGFRKGTQSQLEFLPERHTDFIYSVLSEEHGFVGSMITIGLFMTLFYVMIRIAMGARDKFGALLTVGVLGYLFWHMFVNMGMVMGLLPIVGVPLPLLSYGGSGMITTMTGLGLVSSVAFRRYLF